MSPTLFLESSMNNPLYKTRDTVLYKHKLQHSAVFFSHIALNDTPQLLITQISYTTSHVLGGKNFNPLKQLLSLHTQMVIQVV